MSATCNNPHTHADSQTTPHDAPQATADTRHRQQTHNATRTSRAASECNNYAPRRNSSTTPKPNRVSALAALKPNRVPTLASPKLNSVSKLATLSSAALLTTALLTTVIPTATAAELGYIEVGNMYMALFELDAGNSRITWINQGDYTLDGPQILRPLSATHPADYYAQTVPAALLLNPHAQGGLDAASSRLFGFTLYGSLRPFLRDNNYAVAIRLDSITYAGTTTAADNASVYYYNNGNDDWGSYHADKIEWSRLTDENHLIWNGLGFSNMIHPLVVSLDDFPADYTLTYTLSIVDDTTGENVNATVVDAVSAITGIDSLTFSYDVQSLGATAVPEPAAYTLMLAAATICLATCARRNRKRV